MTSLDQFLPVWISLDQFRLLEIGLDQLEQLRPVKPVYTNLEHIGAPYSRWDQLGLVQTILTSFDRIKPV